jgi:hypothetical protein
MLRAYAILRRPTPGVSGKRSGGERFGGGEHVAVGVQCLHLEMRVAAADRNRGLEA